MSHRLNQFFTCLIIFLGCWSGSASSANVFLLPSDDSKAYTQFINQLLAEKRSPEINYQVLAPDADLQALIKPRQQTDLLVSIGTHALQKTLENLPDIPVLAVLITHTAFKELIGQHKEAETRLRDGKIGAIYLEQPASRYLYLAASVSPQAKRIGTVASPLSSEFLHELKPLTEKLGLDFSYKVINAEDNPTHAIDDLMRNSDVYLALPDSTLFIRGTAKWVLLTGLKWRVPIIGFSARYAEAGALAAIYTTPTDAAMETAQCINRRASGKQHRLPAPGYPESYTLTVNHKVSRKLGLPPLDESALKVRINAMEKKQ